MKMKKLKCLVLFAVIIAACSLAVFSQSVPAQAVGNKVSDIRGKTLDGQAFTLSQDYRGAPTMIVFWSTTCPICHANIPKMNQMKTRFETAGKGKVNFLALTIDKAPKVQNYLKKNPFNFIIVPDAAQALIEYAPKKNGSISMGYPAIFVMDKNGTLVYSKEGGGQTEKVESLLNDLLKSN
jgi:peroxiredoxin